jgi:hypothetical protein
LVKVVIKTFCKNSFKNDIINERGVAAKMENDKLFNFIEKMYSDLNSKMDSMKTEMQTGFKGLRDGQEELRVEVKKTNMVIENEIKPKIDALFDGYKLTYEKTTNVETDIKKINNNLKVLVQEEFQIKSDLVSVKEKLEVIKGGKE